MRRRPRVDANHGEIREALRAIGWAVIDTSRCGRGFADLVAMKGGVVKLIEVKDGAKKPSARKLTLDEETFHRVCAAAGCPVVVIESIDQVASL